jgi:hypothetical protein
MPQGPKKHRWIKGQPGPDPNRESGHWLLRQKHFSVCADCGAVCWTESAESRSRDGQKYHAVLYVRKGSLKVEKRAPPCGFGAPPQEDNKVVEITTRFERLLRDEESPTSPSSGVVVGDAPPAGSIPPLS